MSPTQNTPFGGCPRLLSQYRTIGIGLLRYERSYSAINLSHRRLDSAATVFRQQVTTIPVEVLESYLDDVLDLSVTLEHLFLRRGAKQLLTAPNLIVGSLVISALTSCLIYSQSFPLLASLICSPLIAFGGFFVISRNHMIRRLRFAHLLREEVSYRRGDGRGSTPLRVITKAVPG